MPDGASRQSLSLQRLIGWDVRRGNFPDSRALFTRLNGSFSVLSQ
jgi:hypothetical protein